MGFRNLVNIMTFINIIYLKDMLQLERTPEYKYVYFNQDVNISLFDNSLLYNF